MNVVERAVGRYQAALQTARRRSGAFEHFWRAQQRYGEVLGGRLAAAIAYYGFFALLALGLIAYSILGFLLDHNVDLYDRVNQYLTTNVPPLRPAQIQANRGTVGVVGIVGLLLTGIGWVEAIRSAQRLIWDLEQQPGNLVIRRLVDLGVLVAVFLLMGLSVGTVNAIESLIGSITGSSRSLGALITGWLLTIPLNMILAAALLAAVPRLQMPARRLMPSVVLVALGITLLNTLGRYYVGRAAHNPAYTVVASAVTLLVYLYLFNQLLLFGAALAATNPYGRVLDLAGGRPRSVGVDGSGELR